MRKTLLSALTVLLLLTGCAAKVDTESQFIRTSTKQTFLKNGEVTGTDEYYYTHNDQGLVTDSERYEDGILTEQSHWEYDEFGNVIRVTNEETEGLQITEYKNTLDDKGQIIQQETWHNGVLSTTREITYNSQGKETHHFMTIWDEGDEPIGHNYRATYDWKGDPKEEVMTWSDGRGLHVSEYEDGLVVRQTSYEAENDSVTDYWEYTYDDQNRCIREAHYEGDGTMIRYYESVYDDAARTKTKTGYLADGTADYYFDVYTYDEYGNQILLERYEDGEVYWRIEYTYELPETAGEGS